jgi:ribose transport system substrate-binding protein
MLAASLAASLLAISGAALAAKPNPNPACFRSWDDKTPTISYPERPGPYRVALANGYAGNDWRIQMIQSLKAWAKRPENAKDIKELKIVSTGTDVAAQISAVDNMIAAGYDAIVFIAVTPTAFKGVIKRAARAGTVLVPFDNVLDTDKVVQVNEPQYELEGLKAEAVLRHMGKTTGKVLEVRGLPGNSVDRDRSIGMHRVFEKHPGIEIVTVAGNWDTGTVQKVTADAIATHGKFDGITIQDGAKGAINAVIDAGHPTIPIGGDGANGVRKLMAKHNIPGASVSQAPAMVNVAMQAAIALLKGHELPAMIALPIPHVMSEDFKAGANYFPDLPDSFYTGTGYKECGSVLTPDDLLKEAPDDT